MQFVWYCIYLELMTITMSILDPYAINQSPSNSARINELTWVAEKTQEWSSLTSQLPQKCTLIFSSPLPPLSAFSCSLSVQSAESDQCSTTWSLPESIVANSTQNKLKVASERKVENKALFQLHLTAFVHLGTQKNKLVSGKGLAVFSDFFSVRTLAFIKDLESNGQASSVVTK